MQGGKTQRMTKWDGGVAGDWGIGGAEGGRESWPKTKSLQERLQALGPSKLEEWKRRAHSVESAMIPINEPGVHWFYANVQFPSATDASPTIRIKLTDSLGTPLDILHRSGYAFKQ